MSNTNPYMELAVTTAQRKQAENAVKTLNRKSAELERTIMARSAYHQMMQFDKKQTADGRTIAMVLNTSWPEPDSNHYGPTINLYIVPEGQPPLERGIQWASIRVSLGDDDGDKPKYVLKAPEMHDYTSDSLDDVMRMLARAIGDIIHPGTPI